MRSHRNRQQAVFAAERPASALAAPAVIATLLLAFFTLLGPALPAAEAARTLTELGFDLIATRGTAAFLAEQDIPCAVVNKVYEGRPNIVDMLKNGQIALVMNTTEGAQAVEDSREIRSVALYDKIPYFTTGAGAHAATMAIKARQEGELKVMPLQGPARPALQ